MNYASMSNYGSGMMGGYGYSFGDFLGGVLIFFIKLSMLVLVIAIIASIIMWIKNSFLKGNTGQIERSQVVQAINNDPVLKIASLATVAVIGIVLVYALFSGFFQSGFGMGFNMNGYSGGLHIGYNPTYNITSILILLAKILIWALIISLILAAIDYIKSQYESGTFNFLKWNQKGTT